MTVSMSRQTSHRFGGPPRAAGSLAHQPQAFKELARGESTATALENHLDSLEKKIEEMLARAEEEEKNRNPQSKPSADDSAPSGESRPST
ncbi:hypothetical protein BU23DRAFT_182678 [Bimuria novae-zelandiae CBS 107.79]|uniref:Uncharacterized protein n=1 Tax=Bimuria novae-zelandiae CBS 107.79 TaxID=1447943 RepID=A0A6A5V1Y1_9PLEO|nr:hypothetical protein BU23DRAFT_182678 [Bimuria novae-zelandiae CBS 107.79]